MIEKELTEEGKRIAAIVTHHVDEAAGKDGPSTILLAATIVGHLRAYYNEVIKYRPACEECMKKEVMQEAFEELCASIEIHAGQTEDFFNIQNA